MPCGFSSPSSLHLLRHILGSRIVALFAVDLSVRNLIMRARSPEKESPLSGGRAEILASGAPRLFIPFLPAKLQSGMMHRNRAAFFPARPADFLPRLSDAPRHRGERLLINFQFYATPTARRFALHRSAAGFCSVTRLILSRARTQIISRRVD